MDNNNSPQYFLNKMFGQLNGFIKSVENGEGMNLTDEQKKQYQEELKKQGVHEKLDELKKQKEQLFKNRI
jgi:uncharacterized protein YpuA (DUF1002 family)